MVTPAEPATAFTTTTPTSWLAVLRIGGQLGCSAPVIARSCCCFCVSQAPTLAPLQHLTRRRALGEISNALQAIKSRRQRLRSVASLQCCLLQRHDVSPWTSFRFKRSSVLTDFRRVLTCLASVLRSRGHDVAIARNVDGGTGPAHRTRIGPQAPVFGGASAELLAVPPGGVCATLRASFPHLSLEVMESSPNVPEVVRRADPPAPQADREKQRLEEWHAALAELGSSLRPVVTDGRCTWVHFEGPGLLESCAYLIVHQLDVGAPWASPDGEGGTLELSSDDLFIIYVIVRISKQ